MCGSVAAYQNAGQAALEEPPTRRKKIRLTCGVSIRRVVYRVR